MTPTQTDALHSLNTDGVLTSGNGFTQATARSLVERGHAVWIHEPQDTSFTSARTGKRVGTTTWSIGRNCTNS